MQSLGLSDFDLICVLSKTSEYQLTLCRRKQNQALQVIKSTKKSTATAKRSGHELACSEILRFVDCSFISKIHASFQDVDRLYAVMVRVPTTSL